MKAIRDRQCGVFVNVIGSISMCKNVYFCGSNLRLVSDRYSCCRQGDKVLVVMALVVQLTVYLGPAAGCHCQSAVNILHPSAAVM